MGFQLYRLKGTIKWVILITLMIQVTSCMKFPEDTYVKVLDVPADFDWKTIEYKEVDIANLSTITNESGDTVASFIPAGLYQIATAIGSTFDIKDEAAIPETKAISGNHKQTIYFPAKNKYATIMYEDLFPSKGDMDMNDVVVGINIEYFLDNQGRVLGIRFNVEPRAIGSSYNLIGLAASIRSNPYADIVSEIYHTSNPNLAPLFATSNSGSVYYPEEGITTSQVIPLTGNLRAHIDNDVDLFLNVRNIDSYSPVEKFSVTAEFNSNQKIHFSNYTLLDSLMEGKVNVDIFAVFDTRGKEVHFKGQKPTNKFTIQYFLSTRPKSDFSTVDNWVWAVLSPKSIRHPQEFVKIYNAYPNFKTWAEAGGEIGVEWFKNPIIDSLYTRHNFNYVN